MLYQYTDINAVKSIIENNEIWLTNVRFLNDKEEFYLGLNYLKDAFNNYYKFPKGTSEECITMVKVAFTDSPYIDQYREIVLNTLFVASFSTASNVLSQWRGYGKYAVGFDSKKLANSVCGRQYGMVSALPCHYVLDKKDAIKYALKVLEKEILADVVAGWSSEKEVKSLLLPRMLELIHMYALTFKNNAFSEEKEQRLILANPTESIKIKFRTRNELLIPFVAIPFNQDVVTNVMVGPIINQELAEKSLDMFLDTINVEHISEGYRDNASGIRSLKSDIPFRHL